MICVGKEGSVALEELHGALVLLGRRARGEGAEIAALLGARVHFARIQAILTVSQLTDHRIDINPCRCDLCRHAHGSRVRRILAMTRSVREYAPVAA